MRRHTPIRPLPFPNARAQSGEISSLHGKGLCVGWMEDTGGLEIIDRPSRRGWRSLTRRQWTLEGLERRGFEGIMSSHISNARSTRTLERFHLPTSISWVFCLSIYSAVTSYPVIHPKPNHQTPNTYQKRYTSQNTLPSSNVPQTPGRRRHSGRSTRLRFYGSTCPVQQLP